MTASAAQSRIAVINRIWNITELFLAKFSNLCSAKNPIMQPVIRFFPNTRMEIGISLFNLLETLAEHTADVVY